MFSKATEYALRAVIFIAQKSSEEKKLSLSEIAEAIDSPQSFTAKILQLLTKNSRVVSSVRGPHGGFFMYDKAKQLPVRAILEAMEEDEVLEKCVLGLAKCNEATPCPMHFGYKSIKAQLIQLFESNSIQYMADHIEPGRVFIRNK